MAAANGMSLVWLNIEPYQGPHTASAKPAMAPARAPATSRAVAAAAPMPAMPISAESKCRTT